MELVSLCKIQLCSIGFFLQSRKIVSDNSFPDEFISNQNSSFDAFQHCFGCMKSSLCSGMLLWRLPCSFRVNPVEAHRPEIYHDSIWKTSPLCFLNVNEIKSIFASLVDREVWGVPIYLVVHFIIQRNILSKVKIYFYIYNYIYLYKAMKRREEYFRVDMAHRINGDFERAIS